MILVLGAVATGGMLIGSAVVARHRAAAAADLAALSAAAQLAAGHDAACSAAESVAGSMRATVSACDVEGLDMIVVTDVAVGFGAWLAGQARAAARAGPVDSG